jgi:predicted RNase H-like HicB family nuclease
VKRYFLVIEKTGNNYPAFSPDLPGCIATGKTVEETEERMHKAIEMHLRECISCRRSDIAVHSREARKKSGIINVKPERQSIFWKIGINRYRNTCFFRDRAYAS